MDLDTVKDNVIMQIYEPSYIASSLVKRVIIIIIIIKSVIRASTAHLLGIQKIQKK